MTMFRVRITDKTNGYWDIRADDASNAEELAQERLEEGDTSWKNNRALSSSTLIQDVEEL